MSLCTVSGSPRPVWLKSSRSRVAPQLSRCTKAPAPSSLLKKHDSENEVNQGLGTAAKASAAALMASLMIVTSPAQAFPEVPKLSQPKQEQVVPAKRAQTIGDLSIGLPGLKPLLAALPPFGPLNELPPLPYAYDALEPWIDTKTMEIHHDKHHQAYITNLAKVLKNSPQLADMSLTELQALVGTKAVPGEYASAFRNNGGGHFNHSFFWTVLAPEGTATYEEAASPELKRAILDQLGGLAALKRKFNAAAGGVFGSGWTWLGVDEKGTLYIIPTFNQDNPLMEAFVPKPATPIFGVDVWEHAYYLKHQNRRAEYLDDVWNVVNWKQVSEYYKAATS